jgi:hypothetical protein
MVHEELWSAKKKEVKEEVYKKRKMWVGRKEKEEK